jgi:hypothetical protein
LCVFLPQAWLSWVLTICQLCTPQPGLESHDGRLCFDQFVSSLPSLVTRTQMISSGCLWNECMNNWMKGNEIWILYSPSISFYLITFSLSSFSHLSISSLIFLAHSKLRNESSILKTAQHFHNVTKGLISLFLQRKMGCAYNWFINVIIDQGNKNFVFLLCTIFVSTFKGLELCSFPR